jgi:hypothetical protein
MFSDLAILTEGKARLPDSVHPMPDLLDCSPEQVLTAFRDSQRIDFTRVVAEVEQPGSMLHTLFSDLRARVPADNPFHRVALFESGALERMFLDLHDHVMSHPVWRHPFFVRVFEGRVTATQVNCFTTAYFNQIKNTRQCVALAVGRFHGLMDLPYGVLNERISELTQISLAQLVADEYGIGAHAVEDYPELGQLFAARTHIVMYRQLFAGLDIAADHQDVPMLWGVADNVLTQRLVASHPAFTPLEALASVGLGMEWGVPEFFSLLLGGLIRFAMAEKLALTAKDLEVFIAHVRYDVLHAVSVMLVTSLHMRGESDLATVKNACNTLMAARFGMMTDMHEAVFGERCAALADMGLERRYKLTDCRIAEILRTARKDVGAERVVDSPRYCDRADVPFVFA